MQKVCQILSKGPRRRETFRVVFTHFNEENVQTQGTGLVEDTMNHILSFDDEPANT